MSNHLNPERLASVRKNLGLNKTEAAGLLNLSKMGYGRYEHGERTPSTQIVEYIAWKFGTSAAYLTGTTDDPSPEWIHVSRQEAPALFKLVQELQASEEMQQRLSAYYESLKRQ
ncbi:MAG: helix-turn-helix transcriptional regulator [Eubacteriales bacterium]|nr:helix-turn-helix transcriptional regulator [Sarcina sp.]MBR2729733.1 helix-turn-helix transcriptional regulator [Lachnospiraceae bacterium]MDO4418312.1 helix-turn-helix transcriptional regulator [Eubacteriales bacterium]